MPEQVARVVGRPPVRLIDGAAEGAPPLAFTVLDAAPEPYAAAPTLRFQLAVDTAPGVAVRSVLLSTQIRIGVARRRYEPREQARLVELFGAPDRWKETLRSLYWTHATVVIPPFEHRTEIDLLVPCTYDFDVVASKYFHAVEEGEAPLDFLFSGSVFYDDSAGLLKTARLSWELESAYRLPVRVWREMMDHYFPGGAWIRVGREAFDRLYGFKASRALATWDDAMLALTDAASDSPFLGKREQ
jgi:hypothetical protein